MTEHSYSVLTSRLWSRSRSRCLIDEVRSTGAIIARHDVPIRSAGLWPTSDSIDGLTHTQRPSRSQQNTTSGAPARTSRSPIGAGVRDALTAFDSFLRRISGPRGGRVRV